jgi:2-polyprenyl-3-methyl-5-hydroxy-6-metoxy-1,4-benzoquinol methylase
MHMPRAHATHIDILRHTWDNIGELGNEGMSQHHVPVFIHTLIPLVLPKLGESGAVVDALKRGCRVADVGCGAAGPTMVLASAFPASSFDGFELSEVAIALARSNSKEVPNFSMHDVRTNSIEAEAAARGKYDFVLTCECVPLAAWLESAS